jgi:hypothetical protein
MKKLSSIITAFLILVTTQTGFAQLTGTAGSLTWTIANDTLTIRVTAPTGTAAMSGFNQTGGVTNAPWGIHRNSFSVAVIEWRVTSIGGVCVSRFNRINLCCHS